MSDLKRGDFIAGEYRIRHVFGGQGRSGMGVVYLVEGRSSEEPFVLKTFQSSADAPSIARFKTEAETWVNLGKHRNIVQCHWVREFAGQLFVAAEYVWPNDMGCNTLTQHLAAKGQTLRQQLFWIAQFCFGMKHSMSHGMRVHRDVKPDNLMIDNRGLLKITDFGLAKGLAVPEQRGSSEAIPDGNALRTAVGAVFGTPPFMSPEQFFDSSAVDHRADIYSLGIVGYMMISGGRLPIMIAAKSGDEFKDWSSAHCQQRVVRIDHPLMDLVGKCLEKDANRRFQSYDEILASVEQVCRRHNMPVPQDEQEADAEFERQFSIAMSLGNLGRSDEAIAKLKQMAARWPESSKIHTELGGVYLKLSLLQEAHEATERSLSLYPYSTAAWNNLGGILANLQKFADAKSAYSKSLRIEPENTGAMIGLAQLHMAAGELTETKQLCELALFWRPEKPNVLKIASECLLRCQEVDRATSIIEKLVALDPADAKAWFNLSLCRQARGDAEGQVQALREVLKLSPEDAQATNFLAQVLVGLGRHKEAVTCCDNALRVRPQDVKMLFCKANALGTLGRFSEALPCFQEALKLGDENAARGIEQCQRLLKIDAKKHFQRGANFQQAGNNAEAIRCYDASLSIDATNPDVWINKGAALLALNRGTEAIACFDQAIALNNCESSAWNNNGYALYFMGQYSSALPCLEEAKRLGATHCGGMIAVCREKLGKR